MPYPLAFPTMANFTSSDASRQPMFLITTGILLSLSIIAIVLR
jgi:hypothetical protein